MVACPDMWLLFLRIITRFLVQGVIYVSVLRMKSLEFGSEMS